MKIYIFSFCVLFQVMLFSQKNSLWINHSFTKVENEMLSFNQPTFKKINNFGLGLAIMIEHNIRKSKVSFIKYGIELSSLRQGFYLNGFSNYINNTTIKLPLLYCFKFFLSKDVALVFNLGVKLQFLLDKQTTSIIWNKTTQLITKTNPGFYPLINFNIGTELKFKKNRKLGLFIGFNKGFNNYEEVIYKTISPITETNYSINGSFYELKFQWKLASFSKLN